MSSLSAIDKHFSSDSAKKPIKSSVVLMLLLLLLLILLLVLHSVTVLTGLFSGVTVGIIEPICYRINGLHAAQPTSEH